MCRPSCDMYPPSSRSVLLYGDHLPKVESPMVLNAEVRAHPPNGHAMAWTSGTRESGDPLWLLPFPVLAQSCTQRRGKFGTPCWITSSFFLGWGVLRWRSASAAHALVKKSRTCFFCLSLLPHYTRHFSLSPLLLSRDTLKPYLDAPRVL